MSTSEGTTQCLNNKFIISFHLNNFCSNSSWELPIKEAMSMRMQYKTRMHSSRMRTGRSLTVCRSLLPRGGVCFPGVGGVCLWGVSAPGDVSAPRRVSALGGVSAPRGCLLPEGGVVSQHALRQTLPPVNRMKNRCKNITLATTSLRPVINVAIGKLNAQ